MIRNVTDSDLEPVRVFLERHVDTSLFLLSTLAALGPRLGEHPNSGNFRLVDLRGQIAAVFCLTRRGNLLVQAAGRADLASSILESCAADPIELRGVVGEWSAAESIWKLLAGDPRFKPTHNLKDVLYRLNLARTARRSLPEGGADPDTVVPVNIRNLRADDFVQWERLNTAYFEELRLPVQATLEQRRTDFMVRVRSGQWWGAFDDRLELTSIASLNATYGSVGQVGGVYTRPQDRGRGVASAVMRLLIGDCTARLRFEKLILFTGEDNRAARRLYESLGFQSAGAFGLLMRERRGDEGTTEHHAWAGQSGEVYLYEVFEWPARLTPGPGNYILAASLGAGGWRALLIGECADLSALTAQDALRGCNGGPPATHVHVRPNFNPAAIRRREVSDLAGHWTPAAHPLPG